MPFNFWSELASLAQQSRGAALRPAPAAAVPARIEALEERCVLSATSTNSGHDHDHHADFLGPLAAIVGHAAPGSENFELILDVRRWPQPNGLGSPVTITYSYSNLLDGGLAPHLSAQQIRSAVEEAFAAWAAVVPLHFVEVPDAGPAVSSANYDPAGLPMIRLGHQFIDGGNGTNALAQSWLPFEDGLGGDIHFDNGNRWRVDGGGPGFSLREIALHEIGHALGLTHELIATGEESAGIMNPRNSRRFDDGDPLNLLADDMADIQLLYGSGVGSVTPLENWEFFELAAQSSLHVFRSHEWNQPAHPMPFLSDPHSRPSFQFAPAPAETSSLLNLFHAAPPWSETSSAGTIASGSNAEHPSNDVVGGESTPEILSDSTAVADKSNGTRAAKSKTDKPGVVRLTSHDSSQQPIDAPTEIETDPPHASDSPAEPAAESAASSAAENSGHNNAESAQTTNAADAHQADATESRDQASPRKTAQLTVVWQDGLPTIVPAAEHRTAVLQLFPAAELLNELAGCHAHSFASARHS